MHVYFGQQKAFKSIFHLSSW